VDAMQIRLVQIFLDIFDGMINAFRALNGRKKFYS
jgi:hypothetical protein